MYFSKPPGLFGYQPVPTQAIFTRYGDPREARPERRRTKRKIMKQPAAAAADNETIAVATRSPLFVTIPIPPSEVQSRKAEVVNAVITHQYTREFDGPISDGEPPQ
jgi:hypothetical protein